MAQDTVNATDGVDVSNETIEKTKHTIYDGWWAQIALRIAGSSFSDKTRKVLEKAVEDGLEAQRHPIQK